MEIISREMMKPSSPTPQHLHKHKLSFLDQQAPPAYVSLLFFYEPPSSNQSSIDLSRTLKQSLSQVLTKFYPLAGRIVHDHSGIEFPYVDCNDEGVEYVETRVHARMSDVIKDPDPVDLQKYGWNPSMGEKVINPLSIQVSTFDCGGLAVGACIAHKIADMASFVMFMTDWSKTACRMRDDDEEVSVDVGPPNFDVLSSRFPPRPEGAFPPPPDDDDVVVVMSKRFVFDKGMLSELKRVGSSREVENPSRVEAVTAFVWARRMQRDSFAHHAVNVRPARDDDGSGMARGFGNGCTRAVARWISSGVEEEDRGSVIRTMTEKLRAAIKKAKANERVICDSEVVGSVEVCVFSSWCRFPMYSVDYGWGPPSWVGTAGVPFKNVIVFMDTKDGDGVEAWVNMGEEDIAMVEENYERLHYKLF